MRVESVRAAVSVVRRTRVLVRARRCRRRTWRTCRRTSRGAARVRAGAPSVSSSSSSTAPTPSSASRRTIHEAPTAVRALATTPAPARRIRAVASRVPRALVRDASDARVRRRRQPSRLRHRRTDRRQRRSGRVALVLALGFRHDVVQTRSRGGAPPPPAAVVFPFPFPRVVFTGGGLAAASTLLGSRRRFALALAPASRVVAFDAAPVPSSSSSHPLDDTVSVARARHSTRSTAAVDDLLVHVPFVRARMSTARATRPRASRDGARSHGTVSPHRAASASTASEPRNDRPNERWEFSPRPRPSLARL